MCFGVIESHVNIEKLQLDKFQYFKYKNKIAPTPHYYMRYGQLYSITRTADAPPSKIQDIFNRVKAVFVYFKHLFFGNPKHQQSTPISFPPERAAQLGKTFQKIHGEFGQQLVSSLGSS